MGYALSILQLFLLHFRESVLGYVKITVEVDYFCLEKVKEGWGKGEVQTTIEFLYGGDG